MAKSVRIATDPFQALPDALRGILASAIEQGMANTTNEIRALGNRLDRLEQILIGGKIEPAKVAPGPKAAVAKVAVHKATETTDRTCRFPGCGRTWSSRGLCGKHYQRYVYLIKHDVPPKQAMERVLGQAEAETDVRPVEASEPAGDPKSVAKVEPSPILPPTPNTCRFPACDRRSSSRGLCHKHYQRYAYLVTRGVLPKDAMDRVIAQALEIAVVQSPSKQGAALRGHSMTQQEAPGTPQSKAPCLVPDCGRQTRSRGLCSAHYQQVLGLQKKGMDPKGAMGMVITGTRGKAVPATVIEAPREPGPAGDLTMQDAVSKAVAEAAAEAERDSRGECLVPTCTKKHSSKGFCKSHYESVRRWVKRGWPVDEATAWVIAKGMAKASGWVEPLRSEGTISAVTKVPKPTKKAQVKATRPRAIRGPDGMTDGQLAVELLLASLRPMSVPELVGQVAKRRAISDPAQKRLLDKRVRNGVIRSKQVEPVGKGMYRGVE